jgi:hypothetical protein
MILKSYVRWLTTDIDTTLATLQALVGHAAGYRFPFKKLEIAGIGDFCVVAGTDEDLAEYRNTLGPIVVDDLDATRTTLVAAGGEVSREVEESQTGRSFYGRHPDGVEAEYVQWNDEIADRVFGKR